MEDGVKKINKNNFSKIKFNDSHKNSWIIGDTYVEPTYYHIHIQEPLNEQQNSVLYSQISFGTIYQKS